MEMVYSNKFAVCLLVGNKIMKELPDGSVGLPFGTEYKLRLFNKHDRCAVAKISLDTENVSEGGFVIAPHSQIDIERRADRDTAFKFVELGSDEAIESGKPATNQSREMGLIEVNFHLEKERPVAPIVEHHHHHHNYPIYPRPWVHPYRDQFWCSGTQSTTGLADSQLGGTIQSRGIMRGAGGSSCGSQPAPDLSAHVYCSSSVSNQQEFADWNTTIGASAKLDGCTIDGSNTGIKYNTVYVDIESHSTLIKMFLQGFKQNLVKAEAKPKKRRKSK